MNKNKVIYILIVLVIVIAVMLIVYSQTSKELTAPTPQELQREIIEDTSEQAVTTQPASKDDLIILDYPLPEAEVTSPLTIKGKARGTWFFEGDFGVFLTDWDGKIIASGIAFAQDNWMTMDYVPFEATLEFEVPEYSNRGSLILQKSNPSAMPEHDNALEITVYYK